MQRRQPRSTRTDTLVPYTTLVLSVGPGAAAPGGRGGKIIRVTTLAPDGPGSFKAAAEAKGPRIIVFEVGGVIDMGRKTLTITEPFLTIAGQTAPGPGLTLIRPGIDVTTHAVVLRPLRIYRSAKRRVGSECVSTLKSREAPDH